MGHKVGWLTLYAGVAGGADIILLPEIPYDIEKVIAAINKRTKAGKGFTILAVAEGAISKEDAALSKKEYKEKVAKRKYPSDLPTRLQTVFFKETGVEVRVTVPDTHSAVEAHVRMTCALHETRFGSGKSDHGRELRQHGCHGQWQDQICTARRRGGQIKTVDPNDQMIKEAKRIGISFGD